MARRRKRRNPYPNVSLRPRPDGAIRPRYNPGPLARRRGEQGRDLKHPDGTWFTLEDVAAWCRTILPASAIWSPPADAKNDFTVAALLRDWLASDDVKALAQSTQAGYAQCVDAVLWQPRDPSSSAASGASEVRDGSRKRKREEFSRAPVAALDAAEVKDFYLYLKQARGWHAALACIAVVRAACSWARTDTRWRLKYNPAERLRLARPAGRIVIYTDAEIRALLAAADSLGRASIGDAVLLGLFTGQRQGDRLALADFGLADGRRQLRQSKTGAVVAIPETPQLRARLEAARARVAAIALKRGTRPATIVVDESTGLPYNEHTYRHVFDDVRALAIKGSNEFALAPCPSLTWLKADGEPDSKSDQDLRDTAVTWLARAGCTLPEIAAITGHSPRSIHDILKRYLALTPELADSGIAKLVSWMEKEGMAV